MPYRRKKLTFAISSPDELLYVMRAIDNLACFNQSFNYRPLIYLLTYLRTYCGSAKEVRSYEIFFVEAWLCLCLQIKYNNKVLNVLS